MAGKAVCSPFLLQFCYNILIYLYSSCSFQLLAASVTERAPNLWNLWWMCVHYRPLAICASIYVLRPSVQTFLSYMPSLAYDFVIVYWTKFTCPSALTESSSRWQVRQASSVLTTTSRVIWSQVQLKPHLHRKMTLPILQAYKSIGSVR